MELYVNTIILFVSNFLILLTSAAQIHQWQNSIVDSIQYGRGFTSSEKPFTSMRPLFILSQCEKRCLSSSRCVFLTFDSKDETCKLFANTPSKNSIQKGAASSTLLLKTEIVQPEVRHSFKFVSYMNFFNRIKKINFYSAVRIFLSTFLNT